MASIETQPHPFVGYLQSLAENRAALASLRRGLGQPPGSVPAMYRYVMPWLGDEPKPWVESAYFCIAALFAAHPSSTDVGCIGDHMARCRREADDSALERRFTALLAAHPDDLPDRLRQTIGTLASKEQPINWHQLLPDILSWGLADRRVQKRWARAFWGRANQTDTDSKE